MRLFDEIQARYLTHDPDRIHGRFGTNNGLGADHEFRLEKMHREDRKFQAGMDAALRETLESALANLSRNRER